MQCFASLGWTALAMFFLSIGAVASGLLDELDEELLELDVELDVDEDDVDVDDELVVL